MTDYQNALVLENLDLVNWVIRTRISIPSFMISFGIFSAIGISSLQSRECKTAALRTILFCRMCLLMSFAAH